MDDRAHATESIFSDAKISPSFSSPSSLSSDGVSGEDGSEGWAFIQKNQFKLSQDTSIDELNAAILKCKELILDSDECSNERKWLVQYLIQLRYRVQELKDCSGVPPKFAVYIYGHSFQAFTNFNTKVKQFCDHCSGIIWSVVQGSYICQDCGYICHIKCADKVIRLCANVVATKEGELELNICPEKGLASQKYKCAECRANLSFTAPRSITCFGRLTYTGSETEPRLCDYSGLYYCTTCHWNNESEIPARVVHNWDWEKRPVSQAAFQLLTVTRTMRLINLEQVNEKLFSVVAELEFVRRMRNDLKYMRRYLDGCQDGKSLVSGEMHNLAKTLTLYSMVDLEMARDGQLESKLSCLTEKCRSHIVGCQVCCGKGYFCELCRRNEVIFPFDAGAIGCDKCNSLYHRACFLKKNQVCPKCLRIQKKIVDTNELEDII